MVLGPSQGLVRVTVDAVSGSELSMWIRKPLMMRRQVTYDVCHGRGQEIKGSMYDLSWNRPVKQAHSVKIPALELKRNKSTAGQGEVGFNGGPQPTLCWVVNVGRATFRNLCPTTYHKLD